MATDDLLDLPVWWGQRNGSYRWTLLDGVTGVVKRELTPLRDSPPTLTHTATATITRTIRGVVLGVQDTRAVDPLRDRVRLEMVLAGRRGTTTAYPLGQYLIADDLLAVHSQGDLRPLSLVDEAYVVDQELDEGFAGRGQPVDQAVLRLLDGLPIGEPVLDATDQVTWNGWAAGDSRGRAVTELATLGGYLQPWMDHRRQYRWLRAFDPADVTADVDLDDPPRVVRDSIAWQTELPDAPNRYRVISNAAAQVSESGELITPQPVVGVYDVPSSAPHSIARRGYVVPYTVDAQVATAAQAAVYARTVALQSRAYETVTLTTPPDPRHDGWTVVRWQGLQWLEIGWSLTLAPGGPMDHTLRRAYPRTDEED